MDEETVNRQDAKSAKGIDYSKSTNNSMDGRNAELGCGGSPPNSLRFMISDCGSLALLASWRLIEFHV
jgi:hypothetical protein